MEKENILFALLIVSQASFGQCPEYDLQPPRLSNVVVRSFVAQDGATKIFTYSYSITNGATSTGCIDRFQMDIIAPPDGIELSNVGLVDYPRYVDRSALQFHPQLRIIPVAIPKLPTFRGFSSAWFAGFSVRGIVDWVRAIKRFQLEPGATIDSLIMTSHGIPGLRSFVISPSYNPMPPVIITPENEDSVYLNVPPPTREEEEAFQRLEDSIKFRGLTIGPTAPPANFVATAFLDTLLSYTRQSAALGWLGRDRDDDCDDDERPDDGVVRNIENRLQKARRELVRGDSVKARRELLKLVRKVDRLQRRGERVMTSEAYALLKYNTEYLIERLPERRRR